MSGIINQLQAQTARTSLHWLSDGQLSIRFYEQFKGRELAFCVSTRSAELTFVLEGEMWLEIGPAKQQLRILPGEGCLLLRSTPHRSYTTDRTKLIIIDLQSVNPQMLGVAFFPSSSIRASLVKLLPNLLDHYPLSSQRNLLSGELVKLMGKLEQNSHRIMTLEPVHNTFCMLQIKKYLEQHCAEPLNFDAIARQFSLNRFYLARWFKQNFGASPRAYLQFLRHEHFIWSLLNTHGPRPDLQALASEVGHNDYSTFCRSIRQRFGKAPSELLIKRATTLC
jgi:AraC-like DNA-binding protein